MRTHPLLRSLTLSSALALVACNGVSLGRDTTSGGTGAGGAMGSSGSGGSGSPKDAGHDAPDGHAGDGGVLGQPCPAVNVYCCDPAFIAACKAAGGLLGSCNNVSCTQNPGAGAICQPPPVVDAGMFGCGTVACNVGEVCVDQVPLQDGCEQISCKPPPAACATMLTCACLEANSIPWLNTNGLGCSSDAAGNLSVVYSSP